MTKFLHETKINFLMGLRLACFRPSPAEGFIVNTDQLLMLLMLDLMQNLLLSLLLALPDPIFNVYVLPMYGFDQAIFFLTMLVTAKLWKNAGFFLTASVMALSLSPVLNALIYLDHYLRLGADNEGSNYELWGLLIALYSLVILWRIFYIASGRTKSLTWVVFIATVLTAGLQFYYFGDAQKFWQSSENAETEEKDSLAEYKAMDAEQLMYRQPEILAIALHSLMPQHVHKNDLYFVGFAAYATEDVFSKEVVFAKNLLDKRFDTVGHSINLINHLATQETQPLANVTNLAITLKHIGTLIDKNEDVLMMYLTSHGSEDHKLSVSFWPLPLNDLTPEKLKTMLDDAGIKWRIIIVSACYSGGFINALANDETLVATAAAADKTSFGCGTESEFTYFGEAVFKDGLARGYSFVAALQQAQISIGQREQREHIDASLPQLSVGKAIKIKLDALGEELRLSQCLAKTDGVFC